MSAIGPALPPHLLAKRKRQQEEEAENESIATSGAKRASTPDDTDKRRRVMGPAMPPAPLHEKPQAPADEEGDDSDDSDDDFGPALPTTDGKTNTIGSESVNDRQATTSDPARPSPPEKLQRDDWMMIPPKQDDLAARLDPSKPRPKGFNTGKSARTGATADSDNSTWHETPEQKRKRLENEMMGIAASSEQSTGGRFRPPKNDISRSQEQGKDAKTRGPSLLEQHQQSKGSEVEDDPSKRAFDREKDMAGGMRITASQRKNLLSRASDFESRFSKGSSR